MADGQSQHWLEVESCSVADGQSQHLLEVGHVQWLVDKVNIC